MSSQYELDDTCDVCNGTIKFKLVKLDGHQRRHKQGICQKCGLSAIISQCRCKTEKTYRLDDVKI